VSLAGVTRSEPNRATIEHMNLDIHGHDPDRHRGLSMLRPNLARVHALLASNRLQTKKPARKQDRGTIDLISASRMLPVAS